MTCALPVLGLGQAGTDFDALSRLSTTVGRRQAAEKSAAQVRAKQLGLKTRIEGYRRSIEWIGLRDNRPRFLKTSALEAAQTVGANQLWPGSATGLNLTGLNVNLGVWDGGHVDSSHLELTGRVTFGDSASVAEHATFVGGIMIGTGIDPLAIGMAPEATIKSFEWTSDTSEMATQAAAGMTLSNHSYGNVAGWEEDLLGDGKWAWAGDPSISTTEDWSFGFYGAESKDFDKVAYNAPFYLPVFAASNDRFDGPTTTVNHWEWNTNTGKWQLTNASRPRDGGSTGFDTLPEGGQTAKNLLVVGAIKPITPFYTSYADVTLAGFSSCGPTDDGRIKPDLVAAGVNIYSTDPNNKYATGSGTSFSTPNTSGALALLVQEYRSLHAGANPRASMLKAVAIETANQATQNLGPSYQFGWGVLNVRDAALLIAADARSKRHLFDATLNSGGTYTQTVVCDGTKPLRVTICWTDPAGNPPGASLNPTNHMLVNDLDLRVTSNGTTFKPWVLNPVTPYEAATTGDNNRDNVEQVYIAAPPAGTYTISVTAKATLKPSGSQVFSVVSSGNNDATPGFAAMYSNGNLGFWRIAANKVINWSLLGGPGSLVTIRGFGDTDGDGQADMIGQVNATNEIYVWRIAAGKVIDWHNLGTPGAGVTIRAVADFDGDGKADLLGQYSDGMMAIWYMNGSHVVGWKIVGNPGGGAIVCGAADFDGNGKVDILARYSSGALGLWLMNNASVVGWRSLGDPGPSWSIKGSIDLNGDGRADFVGQSTINGNIAIWYTNGTTVTQWKDLGSPGAGVTLLGTGGF